MERRRVLALPAAWLVGASAHAAATGGVVRTRVETDVGAFEIEVNTEVAPLTVANYLAHVDAKLLDGGSVYRIVTLANQAPDDPAQDRGRAVGNEPARRESAAAAADRPRDHPRHRPQARDGTVSMARSTPGSATSEFFICIGDQPELDFGGGRNPDGQGFAAFGRVVAGQDVVRALHSRGQSSQYLAPPIGSQVGPPAGVRRLSAPPPTTASTRTRGRRRPIRRASA